MDKRDSIAINLTPAQIEEARQLTRDWVAKHRLGPGTPDEAQDYVLAQEPQKILKPSQGVKK